MHAIKCVRYRGRRLSFSSSTPGATFVCLHIAIIIRHLLVQLYNVLTLTYCERMRHDHIPSTIGVKKMEGFY